MVYDAYYDGWTIGAWDDWWTTVGQGDDCWVIAWSPLVFPAVPEAPDPNDDEYEARRV